MSEIKCKTPWPKIQFKTESDHTNDGYLYLILGDKFYISENQSYETMGLAQNWIISYKQIIKFYDEQYLTKCPCNSPGCNEKILHTDLL